MNDYIKSVGTEGFRRIVIHLEEQCKSKMLKSTAAAGVFKDSYLLRDPVDDACYSVTEGEV
jgi:hypothetical protein